jgi:NhaA family Na+:H+ antiporter
MIKRETHSFSEFIKSEQASGVILILCVVISVVIGNTLANNGFTKLLSFELGYQSPAIQLKYSTLSWINDGLMAVFFFLIGLEIKSEFIDGHLSDFKVAAVPVFAAVGGAIIPALIFFALNHHAPSAKGWAIPMATDIAFALGVLALLGKLVPPALKVLLSTLAVVDDLLAIIVIAVFYSSTLHWLYLAVATAIFLGLLLMNRLGVKHLVFYILPGLILWYLIHHSGIHATIAGVLTALTIPVKNKASQPVLQKLAHSLNTPVNFIIMPVFALANTNITFQPAMVNGLVSVLGLGIMLGLVFGKPVGVMLFAWLTVKFKAGTLPAQVTWRHIAGMGMLAGIGFTMSVFISLLSFGNHPYNTVAKFAILVASLVSGIAGFLYLKQLLTTNKKSRH